MCGICGILNFNGRAVDRDLLEAMSSAIQHRGPDGSGSYASGGVGLGHRRLSIIDLEGGSQPLSNEDDAIHVVFNGEIYNFVELREELEEKGHKFKTRSDTEVIVHAYEQWGMDCASRFNGIFAFALWDENRRRLFAARDHLGVKPFYYTTVENTFLFASEIKALLADNRCPREVDLNALAQLFTLRYVPSPDTMFANIKKLPPGHFMVVDCSGIDIKRYWTRKPKVVAHASERQLLETYQDLVEDSVRLQMRSDVPVGLFLSSGVDSGTLLAIMSKYAGRPVQTFTIGFEGGEGSNETNDARAMAARFGAEHSEMMIGPEDYAAYYERYLWDLEEPVGNETAAAFYFVSLIASRKVKVVLTGQGADEPWAGYHRHKGAYLSQLYSHLPAFLTQQVLKTTVGRLSKSERLRRAVLSLDEKDTLTRFIKIYSFYDSTMKEQLFQDWLSQSISTDGAEAKKSLQSLQADVGNLDPLTQMLYMDTRSNLPDDLLMVSDKTSMANSIESRVPFLDYRLIEFIETLPPDLKLRRLDGKYLHKKAAEKWLPKQVVHRKKKGFANPVDKWLKDRLSKYVGDCLLSEESAVRKYFRPDYIRRLLADHDAGRQNYLRHIYLLISFEMWHQAFISKQPTTAHPAPLVSQ
jgi:asparagine synthase (glutamine-hydrolysing)